MDADAQDLSPPFSPPLFDSGQVAKQAKDEEAGQVAVLQQQLEALQEEQRARLAKEAVVEALRVQLEDLQVGGGVASRHRPGLRGTPVVLAGSSQLACSMVPPCTSTLKLMYGCCTCLCRSRRRSNRPRRRPKSTRRHRLQVCLYNPGLGHSEATTEMRGA